MRKSSSENRQIKWPPKGWSVGLKLTVCCFSPTTLCCCHGHRSTACVPLPGWGSPQERKAKVRSEYHCQVGRCEVRCLAIPRGSRAESPPALDFSMGLLDLWGLRHSYVAGCMLQASPSIIHHFFASFCKADSNINLFSLCCLIFFLSRFHFGNVLLPPFSWLFLGYKFKIYEPAFQWFKTKFC